MTITTDPLTIATDDGTTDATTDEIGTFADRLFQSCLGAIDLFTVYLGLRLDLYRSLADRGPITPPELAAAAGIDPRYAREWLEQQTVTGIVACDDRAAGADERRYSLPAAHEVVLLDGDHPACVGPLALAGAGIAGVLPQLLDAYRKGRGVAYETYGADFRDGQAGMNRPVFAGSVGDWLRDGLADVHARLVAGEPLRIADVACGAGWSTIALARAYPHARIAGVDVDDASIADARRNASAAGLDGRLSFEVLDAADLPKASFDLICVFEALHDMSRPVEVLAALRSSLAEGGAVLVMDERVADSFVDSEGPIERFMYGASVLHCLPVGMSEQPSAATGTVMRATTVSDYAKAAGFPGAEVLDIDHEMFRFYRLA